MSFGRPRLARAPFLFPKDRQGLLCVLAVAARGRASTCVRGHRGEPARPSGRQWAGGINPFVPRDRSIDVMSAIKSGSDHLLASPGLTFARAQKHTRTKHQQCGSSSNATRRRRVTFLAFPPGLHHFLPERAEPAGNLQCPAGHGCNAQERRRRQHATDYTSTVHRREGHAWQHGYIWGWLEWIVGDI